jgi:hypothetical protein
MGLLTPMWCSQRSTGLLRAANPLSCPPMHGGIDPEKGVDLEVWIGVSELRKPKVDGGLLDFIRDVRLSFAVHSGQPHKSSIQQALIKVPATCATLPSALTQNSLMTLTIV